MQFPTLPLREKHEGTFHPDLLFEGAKKLMERIHIINKPEKLAKKVLQIPSGMVSYIEAREKFLNEDDEGKEIMKVMQNIVKTYFAHHPHHGVRELNKFSEFLIK